MVVQMASPLVSIIIITRNRPQLLCDCLRHLLAQGCKSFEVVVVDSSSGGRTWEIITSEFPQVRYVHLPRSKNKMPQARNLGLRHARGEIIAFIDDDSMVQPGWLAALAPTFSSPSVGAVGGMVLDPGEVPQADDGTVNVGVILPDGGCLTNFCTIVNAPRPVDHLRGCNMAFARHALECIGGFDAMYTGSNFREETDMFARLKHAGFQVLYNSDALVHHLAARKESYGRGLDDIKYRFSISRNHTYFLCKNLATGEALRSYLLGDTRHLISKALHTPRLMPLVLVDVLGKLTGLGAFVLARPIRLLLGYNRKEHVVATTRKCA
jgi:glycosyltransferase involved in cell wall biosynthesis